MYLSQTNQIRNLSKHDFETLKYLCWASNNLYNCALYQARQYWFQENKRLRYELVYHEVKTNENYKILGTDIGQQTMMQADEDMKCFEGLYKLAKSGKYNHSVKLPRYKKKDSYTQITIPRPKIKDGFLVFPMAPLVRKELGKLLIPFPTNLLTKNIKQIIISPKQEGKYFQMTCIYDEPCLDINLNNSNALSIDFGLDNLCACATNNGKSFIIDGKKLKSYNQWYNKESSRLQSIKDKQGIKKYTNRLYNIVKKRNNQVKDYMNKTTKMIINYCLKNDIGNLIVGYNPNWKKNINIGKINNQNFTQIPYAKLRDKLENKCKQFGIQYYEQEESYTSKSSFFDNDEIPVYPKDNDIVFSGERISRGQYKTSNNYVFNADINGSLNIMRKSNLMSLTALQTRGCLDQPVRIRVY